MQSVEATPWILEVWNGTTEGLEADNEVPGTVAFTGTPGHQPRCSAVILGRGRKRLDERGRRARLRRVARCRYAVVPRKWGMPQVTLTVSGWNMSLAEREEIALMRAQEVVVREIARRLSRSASTKSRELQSNAATRGGKLHYRASTASGRPNGRHGGRNRRNLRSTNGCATTFSTGSMDGSRFRTGNPCTVRTSLGAPRASQ